MNLPIGNRQVVHPKWPLNLEIDDMQGSAKALSIGQRNTGWFESRAVGGQGARRLPIPLWPGEGASASGRARTRRAGIAIAPAKTSSRFLWRKGSRDAMTRGGARCSGCGGVGSHAQCRRGGSLECAESLVVGVAGGTVLVVTDGGCMRTWRQAGVRARHQGVYASPLGTRRVSTPIATAATHRAGLRSAGAPGPSSRRQPAAGQVSFDSGTPVDAGETSDAAAHYSARKRIG
jgi:hypothetical protein